jgi:hypothetical protein
MPYELHGKELRGLLSVDIADVWSLGESKVFYRPPATPPSGDYVVLETIYSIDNETGVTALIAYELAIHGVFDWPEDPQDRLEDFLEEKAEAFIERFCALPYYGPLQPDGGYRFGYPFVRKVIFSTPEEHPGRRRAVLTMICSCERSTEDDRHP